MESAIAAIRAALLEYKTTFEKTLASYIEACDNTRKIFCAAGWGCVATSSSLNTVAPLDHV